MINKRWGSPVRNATGVSELLHFLSVIQPVYRKGYGYYEERKHFAVTYGIYAC